jgi:glucokinase
VSAPAAGPTGGRRAPGTGVRLGLDLGGTNVKAAVLGAGDEVLAEASAPNEGALGEDAVLARVVALGLETAAPFGELRSAGLGLPGHFADGRGVLLPNLPGSWVGRDIAGPVSLGLGVPVRLVNDARALTLAELRLGAGRGARELVCVAIGTGVGGGVVIGGELHLGRAHAGEIGHTTVLPDGPLCGCGNRGCLDRLACAGAIAADAGVPDFATALGAARDGDARARDAFATAGRYVGLALAGAVVLLWPQRIVIGGGVAAAGHLLLDPIREEVARRACVAPQPDIVAAALGAGAGAIGAALWAA